MIPPLPEREMLIRFFVERPALPLHEAARLLGWRRSALLRHARGEGALLAGRRVAWSEVAFLLLNARPRAWLLEMLDAHAVLLPAELHLTQVRWRLPLYLVRALEREAAAHTTPVEDYVANALHLAIDGETVAVLSRDPAFREAYEFPENSSAAGRRDPKG